MRRQLRNRWPCGHRFGRQRRDLRDAIAQLQRAGPRQHVEQRPEQTTIPRHHGSALRQRVDGVATGRQQTTFAERMEQAATGIDLDRFDFSRSRT